MLNEWYYIKFFRTHFKDKLGHKKMSQLFLFKNVFIMRIQTTFVVHSFLYNHMHLIVSLNYVIILTI